MKQKSKKVILILGGITILAILLTTSVFAVTSTTSTGEESEYTPNYSEEQKAEYSFQTGIINGSKYEDSEGDDDYEYTPNYSEEKKAEYSFQTGKVNGTKYAEQ